MNLICSLLIAYRLEVVLINRLVLNLSHTANSREDSEFRTRTNLKPPTFATGPFLGNIGGPVHSLQDEFYDDEFGEDAIEDNEDVQPGRGDGAISTVQHNATSSSNEIVEIRV